VVVLKGMYCFFFIFVFFYFNYEYNPSVFHRELQKNYGILPHSPTDFRRIADDVSDSNTDGI